MSNLLPVQQWTHWWCRPWNWAHLAWREDFARAFGLPMESCKLWPLAFHDDFLRHCSVIPSQPPEATARALLWTGLHAEQRKLVLQLAQHICTPYGEIVEPISVEHQRWCRGVARAIRPGLWLGATDDVRPLLGEWLGAAIWPRLRLAWAPEEVLGPAKEMPDAKLDTLWHSVIWRGTQL